MRAFVGRVPSPVAITISGNDLFIVNFAASGDVEEWTTSGTTVNSSLISGLDEPSGIAIGPGRSLSAIALAGVGAAALLAIRRRKQLKIILAESKSALMTMDESERIFGLTPDTVSKS